ncbi:flagellar FliL protein [Salipiger thiooxidans]|uniref:Flagellar protein FliL n=1 Tax=Salipiger thiooxidans TaxID=282683 RepID=A0A1G7CQG5_9RHOB|nr:flagellar basal body-associated FliL family protein [Salipiger thiooxidans]SDE41010.1 flagellar FliL protein [Salipiger thiooxidans]
MTDAAADVPGEDEEPKKKSSKLPLIIGVVLALVGGGGGFYAAFSGLLPFGGGGDHTAPADGHGDTAAAGAHDPHAADDHGAPLPDANVAFIEMPQMIISMGPSSDMHHLRFLASLEVPPSHMAEVESLKPRVVDVLNNYLRALHPSDIEAPGALIRIRSQMLRRVQLVAGEDRVRDLLIMEFVLN